MFMFCAKVITSAFPPNVNNMLATRLGLFSDELFSRDSAIEIGNFPTNRVTVDHITLFFVWKDETHIPRGILVRISP